MESGRRTISSAVLRVPTGKPRCSPIWIPAAAVNRFFFCTNSPASPIHGRKMLPFLPASYRYIRLDCIGFGYTVHDWTDELSTYNQAELIAQFILKLNLSCLTIIGHGMGGEIALLLMNSPAGPSPRQTVDADLMRGAGTEHPGIHRQYRALLPDAPRPAADSLPLRGAHDADLRVRPRTYAGSRGGKRVWRNAQNSRTHPVHHFRRKKLQSPAVGPARSSDARHDFMRRGRTKSIPLRHPCACMRP